MEPDIVFSHSSNILFFFLAYKAFMNDESRYLQQQEKKKLNLYKMCTKQLKKKPQNKTLDLWTGGMVCFLCLGTSTILEWLFC